jgi:glyceraldehyde 3-phosphate dehydrogenase
MRVAINGMGRIGRTTFSQLYELEGVEVVAFNDLNTASILSKLLRYDSVYGPFHDLIEVEENIIKVAHHTIQCFTERDPANLPWNELNIDIVIDCTGLFKKYDQAAAHLEAGAKRVILSYPVKDEKIKSIVLGVNEDILTKEDYIVSNASCTTNCTSPVVQVIDDVWGIEQGVLNTIHAYTADQRINDSAHRDMRRARAAAVNIVPTTTGAAKAVGKIFPHLDGKITGSAYRVPVITGSCIDLVLKLEKPFIVEDVNDAMRNASEEYLAGILDYSEDELVSTDIIANPHSSIFDSLLTTDANGWLKVVSWYDNEFGYSTRMAELCVIMGEELNTD